MKRRKGCPTPAKHAHPSKAQALKHQAALAARYGPSAALHAYRCPCGSWHVGHSAVVLDRAIRAALRGRRSR